MIRNLGNVSPEHLQAMALQNSGSLKKSADGLKASGDEAKVRQFSKDFESLFVQRLLKEMRKSMPKGGLFEKSLSMEWFEDMFYESISKEVAKGKGIGMATVIYEQLTRTANENRLSSGLMGSREKLDESKSPPNSAENPAVEGATMNNSKGRYYE